MQKYEDTKNLKMDEFYLCPKIAAAKLNAARKTRQTVYLYGATGFGKTLLIASYLEKSRYYYFSVADTRAETIAGMMKKRLVTAPDRKKRLTILVLDELYLLKTQEQRTEFEALINEMCQRRDVWLIMMSRSPVSRWLKETYIHHFFTVISEEDMKFSKQELDRYFEMWELSPTEAVRKKIWDMTLGHPLSVRIGMIHMKEIPETVTDRQSAEMEAVEAAKNDFWDYLGTHVYDQWSKEQQQFIESVSILEEFDLFMAQQITGNKDVGQLVWQAMENGNFLLEHRTESGSIYELRMAVKYSMRRRLAVKYSQDHIKNLYRIAGKTYEMKGNMTEALRMYERCEEEEGISRILIANMKKNPAEGSYFEWKHYYLLLARERIRENVELMTGMSMLQSILMNVEESERWYAELKECEQRSSPAGKWEVQSRLLYLDIALPHRGTEHMTELLLRAGTLAIQGKKVLKELSVTSNLPSLMNGGKDFCEWSKRDRELAAGIGRIVSKALGRYGKGFLDLALAESYFEKGCDLYEVAALAGKGRMQAESGGKQEQVFVAVAILGRVSIFHNQMADAQDILTGFRRIAEKDAPKLLANLKAMEVRLALYEGRNTAACEWLAEAPDEETGFNTMERYRYLTKIRVYLAAGRWEKALRLLNQMQFYAKKMHRTYISIETSLLLAITLRRLEQETWREQLQEAVTAAESYHFVRILSREGAALWKLLKNDPVTWKDESFRRNVMRECRQMADYYPEYLAEKQKEHVKLSDKALTILKLQAEGLSVEQIAHRMSLSKAGVKYYNQETYKKLGVSNKTAAVTEARNRRMI